MGDVGRLGAGNSGCRLRRHRGVEWGTRGFIQLVGCGGRRGSGLGGDGRGFARAGLLRGRRRGVVGRLAVDGYECGRLQALELEQHAAHAVGQFARADATARSQRVCGAICAKRGDHDGAFVDQGAHAFAPGLHDEVGAAHTDGGERGVEAKAVFLLAGGGAGDGAHHAFVEVEADGGGAGGGFVLLDGEARARSHAEVAPIDHAQVDVARAAGLDPLARAHAAPGCGRTHGAGGIDDADLADDEADLARAAGKGGGGGHDTQE